MSAFKKGWVDRFKSESSAEEARVRVAYRDPPKARPLSRTKLQTILPPVINVKRVEDLPQDLTVKEVAAQLRLKNTDTVLAKIQRGEIYAVKEGRQWRIPLWAVAKYLAERGSNVA